VRIQRASMRKTRAIARVCALRQEIAHPVRLHGIFTSWSRLRPVGVIDRVSLKTGRPLARLPLLRGDSVFLTADQSSFFYTDVPVNAHAVKLETAPISRSCLS
jgi:hypothetical protein